MEFSGIALRSRPTVPIIGSFPDSKTHFIETYIIPGKLGLMKGGSRDCKGPARPINYARQRSCGKKEKEKEKKNLEAVTLKKRLKLIKGLSKDLSEFYGMGFGVENGEGLIGDVRGKLISEAAEVLLTQLQQLKAEEKEIKRRKKEEKAARKASRTKAMTGDTSSSSSESNDSDCKEVFDMNCIRTETTEPKIEPQATSEVELALTMPNPSSTKVPQTLEVIEDHSLSTYGQECSHTRSTGSASSSGSSEIVGELAERIEVCMGGKCKKSGSVDLLEEFQKRVGVEGAVVGCKCMGKCRDGPNVRVSTCCNDRALEKEKHSVRFTNNPLYIGVGLEDVAVIVANFFGEKKDISLLAA